MQPIKQKPCQRIKRANYKQLKRPAKSFQQCKKKDRIGKKPILSSVQKKYKYFYFVTTLILGKFPPFPPEPASILIVLTPFLNNNFFTAKARLLLSF